MKISYDKLSRVALPLLALMLTSGSARGFQSAASDAAHPAADSSAAASDAKSAPENAQHAIAKMVPANGIPKFGEVSQQLYRGAQPSSAGLELLAKMGVAIIVNLRPGDHPEEEAEASKLGIRYISIPWHCYHPNDAAIADFLNVLRENPDKKIFVHCELGSDRTGMSVAAYRISVEGWSAGEAMREMQAFGFTGSHHLTSRDSRSTNGHSPALSKRTRSFWTCVRWNQRLPARASREKARPRPQIHFPNRRSAS